MDSLIDGASLFAPLVDDAIRWTPRVIAAVMVFVVGLVLARIAARATRRTLESTRVDAERVLLVERVVRIGTLSLFTAAALQQVEFDLTSFVAGLGIAGVTVGFALQDVTKNLVAGLLLLLQQPFDIGDAIEVSGQAGVVTGIRMRATELRTFEGLEVFIPNADVYAKVVRVFGHVLHRRQQVSVTVPTADLDAVEAAVLGAIGRIHGVVADQPGPRLLPTLLSPTQTQATAWYWIDLGRADELEVAGAAVRQVREALSAAGHADATVTAGPPSPDAVGGVGHVQAREA
ncbi:MAG: small conductance mechanosensitive channel [Myxococcota bacterium]|jgi:small conductance mechanosensitive channel